MPRSGSSSPSPVRQSRSARPKRLAECPVEIAINLIGGKWKLLVLRSLLLNGPQRHNELLASVGRISAKELTRNLRELTASGVVVPRQDRSAPYVLTAFGSGLMPVFKRLLPWGRRLMETASPR
jgi:DNA-binding HxlR family transcriptional regulator